MMSHFNMKSFLSHNPNPFFYWRWRFPHWLTLYRFNINPTNVQSHTLLMAYCDDCLGSGFMHRCNNSILCSITKWLIQCCFRKCLLGNTEITDDLDFSQTSLSQQPGTLPNGGCIPNGGMLHGNGHVIKGLLMDNINNNKSNVAAVFCHICKDR